MVKSSDNDDKKKDGKTGVGVGNMVKKGNVISSHIPLLFWGKNKGELDFTKRLIINNRDNNDTTTTTTSTEKPKAKENQNNLSSLFFEFCPTCGYCELNSDYVDTNYRDSIEKILCVVQEGDDYNYYCNSKSKTPSNDRSQSTPPLPYCSRKCMDYAKQNYLGDYLFHDGDFSEIVNKKEIDTDTNNKEDNDYRFLGLSLYNLCLKNLLLKSTNKNLKTQTFTKEESCSLTCICIFRHMLREQKLLQQQSTTNSTEIANNSDDLGFSSRIYDFERSCRKKYYDILKKDKQGSISSQQHQQIQDHLFEYWTVFRNHYYFTISTTTDEKHNSSNTTTQNKEFLELWMDSPHYLYFLHSFLSSSDQIMVEFNVIHPMSNFIQNHLFSSLNIPETSSSSYTQLKRILSCIKYITNTNNNGIKNNDDLSTRDYDSDSNDVKVWNWRQATRLVQMTRMNNNSSIPYSSSNNETMVDGKMRLDDENTISTIISQLSTRTYYGVFPELLSSLEKDGKEKAVATIKLKHSCVPSCIMEGTYYYNNTNNERRDDGLSSYLRLNFVALMDVVKYCDETGDKSLTSTEQCTSKGHWNLTISSPSFERNYNNHSSSSPNCDCIKCYYEVNVKETDITSSTTKTRRKEEIQNSLIHSYYDWREIKQLADFYMQLGKYSDACNLYDIILVAYFKDDSNINHDKKDVPVGDILHAKCASFLERGLYLKAHDLWKQSQELLLTRGNQHHDAIDLHVRKHLAYNIHNTTISASNSSEEEETDSLCNINNIDKLPFNSYCNNLVFISQKPVLTKEECFKAISISEKHGEWTTSRHYYVPTTDIPIHDIPELLHLFQDIWKTKLEPLFQRQFSSLFSSAKDSRIYIHDAFIVRYNVNEEKSHGHRQQQCYLPMHYDESYISFTIALNKVDEYAGGGELLLCDVVDLFEHNSSHF